MCSREKSNTCPSTSGGLEGGGKLIEKKAYHSASRYLEQLGESLGRMDSFYFSLKGNHSTAINIGYS